jgi:hypothetical protein
MFNKIKSWLAGSSANVAAGSDADVGLARLALAQRSQPAAPPVHMPRWHSSNVTPTKAGAYSVRFQGDERPFPARWNGQVWTDLDGCRLVVQDLVWLG